jgi:hypothetical protein
MGGRGVPDLPPLAVATADLPISAVLTIQDVMARYGWRDRRSARRLMREVGAIKIGARLVVRADDLDRYEREHRTYATEAPPAAAYQPTRPGVILPPGWWRDPDD